MKDMLIELANHARSLDRQLSLTRRDLSLTSAHSIDESGPKESHEHQENEDSIDSLTQEFGHVAVADQPETHFGKSSHFLLIESAMDARREVLGGRALVTHAVFTKLRRPPFWDLCHVS